MKPISGFSLLELMTAMAMLAILVALAAPSYREFTSNNRITAVNNDLITALNLARSEAGRRSSPVTICASADGATCGVAADWVTGWIVFQNPGAAGVIAQPADIVQKWNSALGTIQFTTESAYVRYQPTGMTDAAAAINIDIAYSGCKGPHMRHVQISPVGTISTQLRPCP